MVVGARQSFHLSVGFCITELVLSKNQSVKANFILTTLK